MVYVNIKDKQNCRQHNCTGISENRLVITKLVILTVVILTAVTIPCYSVGSGINWTEDELAFMEEHPVIRIGVDPGFVPFEFIDGDGEYRGISADFLALISEKTGLKFEVVKGLTWPEAYDSALSREIDMLPALGRTTEREKYFLFSEPYYYYKRVIVTRDTDTRISGINDLEGLAVAVQRNSSHHSYLLSYPGINLSLYDSVEVALTAVSTGNERAFIGNLATTNYIIRTNGLTNLRFVSFEAEKQQALYFAVRKDWPELVSIINKAMDTVSDSERLAISNKWVELDTVIDYRPVIRVAAIAGSLTAVVLFVSFFWIARLRKEIERRKKIQRDLEEAKLEADKANAFKSVFLARMSHEIRTPLNAIMGISYLLKKTDISLTQGMYIDRISQAANSMLSIINDILDFSKIEAGKMELEITSFSMDKVIQNVVNIVSYKIDEQGIGFRLTKDPHVPDWFLGDSKRLEQILLNVLNNAVKFTSEGEVSLDVRLIARENDRYHIAFTISDTGIGMTEEQIERLFTPFEQGDSSISRRFGGSGLGLSIVKSLLDLMGGEIEVFSTPDEGSAFVLRLPLRIDKEKENICKKEICASYFRDVRTLILEKSGANINLIESYLSGFGMHCDLTNSEASAISMLEAANGKFARPYDLFIIDYDTPSEGGFRFVQTIRNNNKIAKLPKILMLLPMMREDLFDRLGEYGIDMGVGKPIIPSILLNGILDLFNLKAVSEPRLSENKKPETEKPENKYTVLLAEDNKTNRLIAETLLNQAGIETITAGNGKEAVELYQKHMDTTDLILMDLHMPVMNGYEAAEKIREMSARVPIAAMTADVVSGVLEKCRQSGIYHYISKPFNPEFFVRTVMDIIRKNRPAPDTGPEVLDRQLGLMNMGNNSELYHRVLEEYRSENLDTLTKLGAAIREKRFSDAADIVHKVKSSSGSIGAKSLYDTAVLLQKALDEEREEDIASLFDRFSKLFEKLLEELNDLKRGEGIGI